MSERYGFRGAVVGGFNRADVVSYISRLSAEHRRERAELEERAAGLSSALAEARENLADCTAVAAELVAAGDALAKKSAELEALKAESAELREKANDLACLEAAADRQREAVREAKIKLAEIELAARDRARQIVEEAEANARRLLEAAEARHNRLRDAMSSARRSASEAVTVAVGELERLRPALERLVSTLDETAE